MQKDGIDSDNYRAYELGRVWNIYMEANMTMTNAYLIIKKQATENI